MLYFLQGNSIIFKDKVELVNCFDFVHYFVSESGQYQSLQTTRGQTSSTEVNFLKFLYKNGIRLPDKAQPKVKELYVRPDFYYSPNIYIFCDGKPHDDITTINNDKQKRLALHNSGHQILTWHYKKPHEEFVKELPNVFVKVR